jgi:hypothetical protein
MSEILAMTLLLVAAAQPQVRDSSTFPKSVPDRSLALRMFSKVFPSGMKTAPGDISEGRFR